MPYQLWLPAPLRAASRSRTWLLAVGAVTVCLVVFSGTLLTAQAQRSPVVPQHLRIATWNMCDVRQWGCRATDRTRKMQELERLGAADGVWAVLLQEVCSRNLDGARKALGDDWHTAFRPYAHVDGRGRTRPVRCEGQGKAGIGILAASPLSRITTVQTPQPAVGLQRGILCASMTALDLRVCNAHLTLPGSDRAHPDWEYRDDQLQALVDAASEPRTLVGGDFNSSPPGPHNPDTWIWPRGFYRHYRECDQASASSRDGRATHQSGHKLDYLFTALPRHGCEVRETSVSDHRVLILEVATGG